MSLIRTKLARTLPDYWKQAVETKALYGQLLMGAVNIAQVYGGLRGVQALICDTSEAHPQRGLILRGWPVIELQERLPEEVFWLLVTGSLPTKDELTDLQYHITARKGVPRYIWELLKTSCSDCPPMTLLSMAVLALQRESVYARRIWEKQQHRFWEYALEDALNIIARIPVIAAGIYRLRLGKQPISPQQGLDWAANFAYMLGMPDSEEAHSLMRRYMVVHSDHENGNATAFSFTTVASALADPYTALSAGFNALAGPLHGAASQGSIEMIRELLEKHGTPDSKQVEDACWERLNAGRVIPGYGHAVLRELDPRFVVLHSFGQHHFPEDPAFHTADLIYKVAPHVLKKHGKAANPYPNVDAITGAVLLHYGVEDSEFYTAIFGVGLMLGLLAQYILMQGGVQKLIRPRSITTEWLQKQISSIGSNEV